MTETTTVFFRGTETTTGGSVGPQDGGSSRAWEWGSTASWVIPPRPNTQEVKMAFFIFILEKKQNFKNIC